MTIFTFSHVPIFSFYFHVSIFPFRLYLRSNIKHCVHYFYYTLLLMKDTVIFILLCLPTEREQYIHNMNR